MKTSTLILSVGLTFGLTSGLPNPASTTVINTITVAPAAGSPYPAGPTTNEFQYLNYDEKSATDVADRTIVHNAFTDWAAVVSSAVKSLGDSGDKTYLTWFPDVVVGNKNAPRVFLTNVFNTLFDSSAVPPAPQSYIASFDCDNRDYGGVKGQGICDDETTSYFSRLSSKFHVCPVGLKQKTKATDIKCSDLGDVVSSKMYSLTGSLVHEFMHSKGAGEAVPGGKITDVMYGASNCMRMAKGSDSQKAFINADSYKWFAVNAFYNSYCKNPFKIPIITEADFKAGIAELKSSPMYNVGMSEGVLAGV